jgi:hypothetical protein
MQILNVTELHSQLIFSSAPFRPPCGESTMLHRCERSHANAWLWRLARNSLYRNFLISQIECCRSLGAQSDGQIGPKSSRRSKTFSCCYSIVDEERAKNQVRGDDEKKRQEKAKKQHK